MFLLTCKHCGKEWRGLQEIYTAIVKEFDCKAINDPDLQKEGMVWVHHEDCSNCELVHLGLFKRIQRDNTENEKRVR